MAVTGDQLVAEARRFLGDPYVYGAAGPSRFDCSGLMQYVFKQLGISIPRTSEEQATIGQSVSRSDVQPGDLVFSVGDGTFSRPGHVGMYAGSGQVIEAPHPGSVVRLTDLNAFQPSSYRRVSGITPGTGSVVPASSATNAGDWWNPFSWDLSSIPEGVGEFFSSAVSFLKFFSAFTKISTWVRVGCGMFGMTFLAGGIVFLVLAARE